jgi:hypothetical protein
MLAIFCRSLLVYFWEAWFLVALWLILRRIEKGYLWVYEDSSKGRERFTKIPRPSLLIAFFKGNLASSFVIVAIDWLPGNPMLLIRELPSFLDVSRRKSLHRLLDNRSRMLHGCKLLSQTRFITCGISLVCCRLPLPLTRSLSHHHHHHHSMLKWAEPLNIRQ